MKLQHVDRLNAQTQQRAVDRRADVCAGVPTRLRYPFGQDLDVLPIRLSLEESSHDLLGGSIVVRHVERGQPGIDVCGQRPSSGLAVDRLVPLHVRDLP